jgi:hypothetical protein
MAALAILFAGTFVLRPSISGLNGRVLYYVIRVGVLVFATLFGSQRPPHRNGAAAGATSDPFADSTPSNSSGTDGGGTANRGPTVMEFH